MQVNVGFEITNDARQKFNAAKGVAGFAGRGDIKDFIGETVNKALADLGEGISVTITNPSKEKPAKAEAAPAETTEV